ncbi:DAHL domain-containing protein [Noviherbaspirillum sp. ST9]|uniref:DAHL domain-containing protein n=1 Tax=Noviherbaspirillum sp. ST9 TaxID=3401606 RepID=UPI003B587D54
MKSPRSAPLWLGFAALLAISGYLYYQTQAIDTEMQNEVVPALRELKQLDAEWNTNILQSRVGLHSNYDPLTTPLPAVRQLRERLVRGIRMGQGSSLKEAVHAMEQAFADKEDLVEQFKSQNALLQNSLRYFPTAVEEFKALVRQHRGSGRLQADIDRLLTDILLYNLMPEKDPGERISAAIARLDGGHASVPEALQEQHALLRRHAHIILRQRAVEDALIARITGTPTAGRIDTLNIALDDAFQEMLHEKQLYRLYLFVYSGFLLALLTYAAWRLMHSYKVIARVNRSLQAANETLELRVAERTAELDRKSALLEELATHDTLTGLINRRHLLSQIEQAMVRAERRGWIVALMFIDLDGFKAINDTYGHATGDRALQEVALRLRQRVRKEDVIARLGGDEFVILMNEVGVPAGAARLAEAVLEELHAISDIDGQAIRLSASIGIASASGAATTLPSAQTLLGQADQAMYRAKQQGKGCYCFSDECVWPAETDSIG